MMGGAGMVIELDFEVISDIIFWSTVMKWQRLTIRILGTHSRYIIARFRCKV